MNERLLPVWDRRGVGGTETALVKYRVEWTLSRGGVIGRVARAYGATGDAGYTLYGYCKVVPRAYSFV